MERRRARHHARFRLLALVHDALPRHRGPRRGQLGPVPAPRARRLARPRSGRSTSPPGRCTGCSGSPASRSAPGARTARAAAACGSTASPRPRPPRLREELLHRREPAPAADAATPPPSRAGPRTPEIELARLDPSWVRYAPFTLSGLVSVGVVLGFLAQRRQRGALRSRALGPGCAIWPTASTTRRSRSPSRRSLALALVAVVVASTVGYALAFWDFRLTRHSGGTLHVTRGLITTRATTIEERRLHGAEISEPLLLRMVAGARLIAIATGLRVGRGAERGGSLLVPPAPRAEVAARGRRGHRRAGAGDVPARRARAARPRAGATRARSPGGRCSSRRWRSSTGRSAARRGCRSPRSRCCPSPWLLAADRYRSLGHAIAGRAPGRAHAARSCAGAPSWRPRASSAGTSSARSSSAARAWPP